MKTAGRRRRSAPHDSLPLRTVAAMTGLTPDLIRAWEKRYAVVSPIRGTRGARLYAAADVAHLRLLARVVGAGRAIGDVATLAPAELEELGALPGPNGRRPRKAAPRADLETQILDRLRRFDHAGVSRLLGDALVSLGVRPFVHEIVLPLVDRVGARWAHGDLSIAEEHLLIATLRNLLTGLIHGRTVVGRPILLATPAGERHEIGLLVVALSALDAGVNVAYLGVDLPAAEIVTAAVRSRARVVGLSLVGSANRARSIDVVKAIRQALPAGCELWLGGGDARNAATRIRGFRGLIVDDLEAAETELTRLATGAIGRAGV